MGIEGAATTLVGEAIHETMVQMSTSTQRVFFGLAADGNGTREVMRVDLRDSESVLAEGAVIDSARACYRALEVCQRCVRAPDLLLTRSALVRRLR